MGPSERAGVLLCEAYEPLQEALSIVLSDRYRLTLGSDVAALDVELVKDPPDLLILDVDGQPAPYEAVTSIRQTSPNLPILLLAGQSSLEQQPAVVPLGKVTFVQKPFRLARFLDTIQTLIQGYSPSPIRKYVVRIAR